jgi:phosphoribosyl-dephospho-CoA transferase
VFQGLSIKRRLQWLVILIIGVVIITNTLGILGMQKSNESINDIFSNKMLSVNALNEMKNQIVSNRMLINGSTHEMAYQPR